MLKISEMARLADTTRRTLIFYDEAGVFSPAEKNAAGYRYYDYGQLYDLLFILGLRKLGLSISQIKAVQGQATPELGPQLVTIQNRLDQQITELSRIRSIIDQKVQQQAPTPLPHYVPRLVQRPRQVFWCSTAAASCTEEEVAELFAAFYQQLGDLALMKTGQSGFITDLPEAAPMGYEQAGFRIIKEATAAIPDRALQAGRAVRRGPRREHHAGNLPGAGGHSAPLPRPAADCHRRSVATQSGGCGPDRSRGLPRWTTGVPGEAPSPVRSADVGETG